MKIASTHPYKADYEKLTSKLLYENVSYEEALRAIPVIADFLEGTCAL